ncbi:hypothetical protein DFH28DRAFT_917997 [Melampsora americana]|nr:hypothetical protein DFH28DRAFT_917997 [Melampsora americana]
MAALHQQGALEHQRYSEQSYEGLLHFQRPTTNHNSLVVAPNHHQSSIQSQAEELNLNHHSNFNLDNQADIDQIQRAQQSQHGSNYLNQDQTLPRPPLIDNRPSINQRNPESQSLPIQISSSINSNESHQVLDPHPQRASTAIDISSSLLPHSASQYVPSLTQSTNSGATSISTIHQPGGKKASKKSSKSSSQPKTSTQSKTNKDFSLLGMHTNAEEEMTAVKKTNKAMLDEFLTPAHRLPKNIVLPAQLTVAELFELDASQLRTLADQHTRGQGHGAPSESKRKILRDFHTSTEKLLAILCIHLGISQDVAANEIGKCASFRAQRNYDFFIKSKPVSEIYQQSEYVCLHNLGLKLSFFRSHTDGGPLNPVSRELVKQLWQSYTKEEQNQFCEGGEEWDIEPGSDINNDDGVNPNEIHDNRPTETGLVTIIRGSNDEVTRKNGFRTKSRDLALSKAKCENFVAHFIQKANNMSRIHPVQFTITAVSTHLSKHCFQYMTTTPGLWEWVDHDINSSPHQESTTSRMQAFLTGRTVAGLARPRQASNSRVELEKLKATLNQIIRTYTVSFIKPGDIWKWSNCEARLAEQGFKMQYEPSDPVYKFWITHPNSAVTEEKARQVNIDLVTHPVSLIPIPDFVFKYKFGRNKKRKTTPGFEEEEDVLGNDEAINGSTKT